MIVYQVGNHPGFPLSRKLLGRCFEMEASGDHRDDGARHHHHHHDHHDHHHDHQDGGCGFNSQSILNNS